MIPIRIILADDHEVFRMGLVTLFADQPGIELVDHCMNGEQLVALVKQHRPDVVLTDIQMEVMDGIHATKQISRLFPETPVIALSMYTDSNNTLQMLRAGAVGYLVKNARPDVIMEAIRSAFRGEKYYCRTSSRIVSALITSGKLESSQDILNPTELRILKAICEEKDLADIAREINCSYQSIKQYRKQMMEKCGVASTVGLVLWAVEKGICKV